MTEEHPSPEELIAAYYQCDENALAATYEQYHLGFVHFFIRRGVALDVAEDLVAAQL